MKLIIAGGRNYTFTQDDVNILDSFKNITEVISGGARGADRAGELYARQRNIPIKQFIPNWDIYGKSAGHIRNKQMADYADAVILFPGGKGTESMYKAAKKAGITVVDYRFKHLYCLY